MVEPTFTGLYRGVVHSTKDPLNQGRVKVRVKQLFGEVPTNWAWPVQLSVATLQLPAVGQGVWVMFEGGDPSFPIWVGTFGKYQGAGSQVKVTDLPQASYPATIVTESGATGTTELNLLASVIALAEELDGLITAYNSHTTNTTTGALQTPYTRQYS